MNSTVVIVLAVTMLIALSFTQRPSFEIDKVYRAVLTPIPFDFQQQSATEWVLSNGVVHGLYICTNRIDGHKAETFSLLLKGHSGGVIMTYVDEQLVAVTHNSRDRAPSTLPSHIRSELMQIAQRIRQEFQEKYL